MVGPGSCQDVQGKEAVLFQHGGDGDGRGHVEEGEVHGEGGGVDGGAETAEEDLSFGVSSAVSVGFGGEHKSGWS